nr:hypothetical protein [Tanacetum cinerariifolium]
MHPSLIIGAGRYNNDDSDYERTESDRDENPNLNQSNTKYEEEEESKRVFTPLEFVPTNDEEKMDEEEDDNVTKELYKDVNMNMGSKDVDMTDANQDGADQHNVSQESGFEHEEEDTHVTLTAVHEIKKNEGPMQSYFVSSNFTDKLLNIENTSPADNEIASLMDSTIHHEEPNGQTSSL